MFFVRRFTFVVVIWTAAALTAGAAGQSSTATFSANVSPLANLSISSASVSFPDADPDTVPQIPALGGPLLITAKARANPGAQVVLSVQAADDLRSGVTLIPITNLTWTATGAGFVAGTMSKTASVTVASWVGSGVRSGSQQLFFRNLWTHPTGTYTVSLLYTLSAP